MKLEEMQVHGERDLTINPDQLDAVSGRVPFLISKWLKWLTNEKLQLILDEDAFHKVYKTRYEYYLLHYQYKLTKDDVINRYLPADDELIKVDNIRKYTIEKMKYIEGVIKTLQQMTFTVKNMIEWKQFQHGR